MKLIVFRALWGMTGAVSDQIERIARAGYEGIDFWPEHTAATLAEIMALSETYQLKRIAGARVADKASLAVTLHRVAEFQPMKIILHGGKDSMTRDEGCAFLEAALRVKEEIGIPVAHETHRGCLFFSPWDTAFYLRHFDSLRINADYSHWVNVCERLPDDQAEALELANQRAIHIHGRVGYEEGPQVSDPSAPEYAAHLSWHEKQWRRICKIREQAGDEFVTFTPEYGPPRYLHTLPHTDVPVADLWQVCLWAAQRARQQLGEPS